MELPKFVKKKLVTVRCNVPFRYNKIPFAGICNRVILTVEAINYALMNKAFVVEHLKNGKEVQLGFDNYNTYNGPTDIDDNSDIFGFKEPEIEMIDGFGNKKIINKTDTVVEKPIKYINLDEEKRQKEEEEKKRIEAELQRQKQAELDKREAEIKAQVERDKKAREEAAAKILKESQIAVDKSAGVQKTEKDGVYSFDLSSSAEVTISSDQQDNKKLDKKDIKKK